MVIDRAMNIQKITDDLISNRPEINLLIKLHYILRIIVEITTKERVPNEQKHMKRECDEIKIKEGKLSFILPLRKKVRRTNSIDDEV